MTDLDQLRTLRTPPRRAPVMHVPVTCAIAYRVNHDFSVARRSRLWRWPVSCDPSWVRDPIGLVPACHGARRSQAWPATLLAALIDHPWQVDITCTSSYFFA